MRPTVVGDPYKMYLGEWYEAPLNDKAHFAHELTHVWQLHHFPVHLVRLARPHRPRRG